MHGVLCIGPVLPMTSSPPMCQVWRPYHYCCGLLVIPCDVNEFLIYAESPSRFFLGICQPPCQWRILAVRSILFLPLLINKTNWTSLVIWKSPIPPKTNKWEKKKTHKKTQQTQHHKATGPESSSIKEAHQNLILCSYEPIKNSQHVL